MSGSVILFLIFVVAIYLIKFFKKKANGKTKSSAPATVTPTPKTKTSLKKIIWKYIWIGFLVLGFANFIYPGNWFVGKWIYWFFAPSYEKSYLAISKNQMKHEIASPEKNLAELAQTAKTRALTESEKRQAEQWKRNIEAKEKFYQTGKLTKETKFYERYVIEGLSTEGVMEREKDQEGYRERIVTSLNPNDYEIEIRYINEYGIEKKTKLTRQTKNQFYVGRIENTHPKAKRKELKFCLIRSQKSPDTKVDYVTNEETTTYPIFEGWVGENEIRVTISKKVTRRTSQH